MQQPRTVVFQALRRSLLAALAILTFVGSAAVWGLWTEGRSLEFLALHAARDAAALADVREGISAFQTSLLHSMNRIGGDAPAAVKALQRIRAGVDTLTAEVADPALETVRDQVGALKVGWEKLQRPDPSAQDPDALDELFRDLVEKARGLDQAVAALTRRHLERERQAGEEASAGAAQVRLWVGIGTLGGWLLLASTIAFALRRLQSPFGDILRFMRAAGEKDLRGDLAAGHVDELGALAEAAARLGDTLVGTLGTLGEVAREAGLRGSALQADAAAARRGAEGQLERVADGAERAREVESSLGPLSAMSAELRVGAEQAASSVQQILAMTEEIRAEMEGLSDRVANSTRSVEELSEATSRVAAVAAQLGAAAQTVAASAVAIEGATETLCSGAGEGRELAEQVVAKASEGRHSMVDALQGMERIHEAVDEAVRSFERLEADLGRVGRVTQVIDDIAARTNLLSLNAAIIAAQAGGQGKAFSVVATEIRTLAEKTAANTREIRAIVDGLARGGREAAEAISEGVARVGEGEQLVRGTDGLLAAIFESADHTAGRLREVEDAARGQAREAARVSEEIRQVSGGVVDIVAQVRDQEARSHGIRDDLAEMEKVAYQVARASEEETRGTEMITHAMVEVSRVSERVDGAIASVRELLTALREDLEDLGDRAREELDRVSRLEVEGRGLADLAGQLQAEVDQFQLPGEVGLPSAGPVDPVPHLAA